MAETVLRLATRDVPETDFRKLAECRFVEGKHFEQLGLLRSLELLVRFSAKLRCFDYAVCAFAPTPINRFCVFFDSICQFHGGTPAFQRLTE